MNNLSSARANASRIRRLARTVGVSTIALLGTVTVAAPALAAPAPEVPASTKSNDDHLDAEQLSSLEFSTPILQFLLPWLFPMISPRENQPDDPAEGAAESVEAHDDNGHSDDPVASTRVTVTPEDKRPNPAGNSAIPGMPVALQGQVVRMVDEDVYVCATGNGYGFSHVGVTKFAGASGEETKADALSLCMKAMRISGALVAAKAPESPEDSVLVDPPRSLYGNYTAQCKRVADDVVRCETPEKELITIWDVANA